MTLFLKNFDWSDPLDWVNVDKLRDSIRDVLRQLRVTTKSDALRDGGLTDDEIADYVGEAILLLGGRARTLAKRLAAWFFTAYLPYMVVYWIVCVRGLFSFFFSWKFFTIMMLCFTLFVVEYVLRAQP